MERNCEARDVSSNTEAQLIEAAKHFFTQNDGDWFLGVAKESLENGQIETLLDILQHPEYRELLGFVGWELLKIVFSLLTDDCSNCEFHIRLLKLICNVCNPREICLSSSEQFSHELTFQKLVLLLEVLRQTCYRLAGKISKIVSSILAPLQRCIRHTKYTVEQQEAILQGALEFVDVLVEKVRRSKSDGTVELAKKTKNTLANTTDDVNQLKNNLVSFLIGLLEHPISLLELRTNSEVAEEQKSSEISVVRRNITYAEKVVEFLGILENGCFKQLLDYGVHHDVKLDKALEFDDEDISNSLSYIGLGCLSFLIHFARVGREYVAEVTTWKYSLDTNMVYINSMLSHNDDKVISKGLHLLNAVLDMIIKCDALLSDSYVDDTELSKMLVTLQHLMIYSKDKGVRKESVESFRNILDRFKPGGKYRLIRGSFQGSIQSGFAELLTLILKEEIARSLESCDEGSWFLGSNVGSFLLEDIFKLPSKAVQSEFLIVEENSRILSALSLLRFLLIKDDQNKTTIYTLFPKLKETYLKDLKDVAKQSKARITTLIQLKRDEMQGKSPARSKAPNEIILNVTTTEGRSLEQSSLGEQFQVLQSACLTVDLIESVLERIQEIYENEHSRNIQL